jgi:hypothetical protein
MSLGSDFENEKHSQKAAHGHGPENLSESRL